MPRWLTLLAFCLMPLLASAEVAIPPLQHRVTDLTATLSSEQQADLEARLAGFEAKKGSQIAILIVPTTQPEDIAQYSIRVAEAWKLGRKGVDDGVLVLLAKDDHRSRIEVGYGLEGALPDAIAKRIVSDVMRPYFKQGDFYGGLVAGADKIASVIDGEALPEPAKASRTDTSDSMVFLAIIPIVIGGILREAIGKFKGGLVAGSLTGIGALLMGVSIPIAIFAAIFVFIFLMSTRGYQSGNGGGGWGGGGFGDGGFSGGGGGFGGGGASGDW